MIILKGKELVQYVQRFRDSGWPMPWWHNQIPDWPETKEDLKESAVFTLIGEWARMYEVNIHTGEF